MIKIKRLILSRTFVISIILLIVLTIISGYIFHQSMTTSQFEVQSWLEDHPFTAPVYLFLGLGHIYTSPWFSFLLAVLMASMVVSTIDQGRIAWRKTFGSIHFPAGSAFKVEGDEKVMIKRIRDAGYIMTLSEGNRYRFIRHPWGLWGSALLHAGIVIVVISALTITVTESRGLLHLVEGELYIPGEPWVVEEAGMFASRFILPVSVKLEKLRAEFWETDDVKNISTTISITDTTGDTVIRELGINRTLDVFGLRIYQGRRFGDAFLIEIMDSEGRLFREILQIEKPPRRDRESYGSFFIEGIPFMLKAKYVPDAAHKSMYSRNPLLTLRLISSKPQIAGFSKSGSGRLKMAITDDKKIAGEATLKISETKPLGPYTVRLAATAAWCGIIFVRSFGVQGIFAGFFIIITGVSLSYLFPPREAVLSIETGGPLLYWRASKFKKLYEDEFNTLLGSPTDKESL